MKNGRFFLDTNAVISLLRGDQGLREQLEEASWVGISVITVIEFLSFKDLTPEDKELLFRFCQRVEVIDLVYSRRAFLEEIAFLRQKNSIKTPDAVILASALDSTAELLTADTRLFAVYKKLQN